MLAAATTIIDSYMMAVVTATALEVVQ